MRETEDETKAAMADDAGMPAWLREDDELGLAVAEGASVWTAETPDEPVAAAETGLDWLTELGETPEAAEAFFEEEVEPPQPAQTSAPTPPPAPASKPEPVKPAPPPPPVAPAMAAPAPEIQRHVQSEPIRRELFEKMTQRLKDDPNDYAARLSYARALRDDQQIAPSLDQYETLIDTAQLLQDVSDDLSRLSEGQPAVPRVRRLLGDVYMRRGMLQEALNAYRSALEHL
jgi:outer membrane biosynthesis protein TonB